MCPYEDLSSALAEGGKRRSTAMVVNLCIAALSPRLAPDCPDALSDEQVKAAVLRALKLRKEIMAELLRD